MKEPITPWNPSRRAIARVKDPLPAPTHCHYCRARVEIVNNAEIYNREFGEWPWAYKCTGRGCRAYVGMHQFTNIPLGSLADSATRRARAGVKEVFNALWRSGRMTREQAYKWLAGELGMKPSETHIGWMDVQTCQRALAACLKLAREEA
jgi:hypothetical protein